ncbi:MAG TPA: DUF222 domain-containing protein [Ilumatobacter sp.]|nr:DUF222 domain-containing protein [Ilumatobacter sp.]
MTLVAVPDRPEWLEVEDAVADAAGFLNLGHAQLVDVIVRALRTGVCSGAGYVSPAHWLTVHVGVTGGHANDIVRVAEQAHDFPCVMALLRAGKLSLDQTVAAIGAAPSADRRVADFAELATVSQIRKFVRTIRGDESPGATHADAGPPEQADGHHGADASSADVPPAVGDEESGVPVGDDPFDDEEPGTSADAADGDDTEGDGAAPRQSRGAASVSFGFDEWSQFWIHGSKLTTEQGMVIEAALAEARDHLFRSGHPQVTWTDALVEMARRSLEGAGTQRAERFKTYLHINVPERTAQVDGARTPVSEEAVLTNGVPVPPSIRDYLTCDSLIQIVWQQGNQPIGVGRTTRAVPNRLRRLIELRDQGCCIPGCTNTLGLQVHHLIPWSQGGTSEMTNLVLICDAHHHQHHAGEITIVGNPDLERGSPGALTVSDRHGRSLRSHPTPRPPNLADLPSPPRYQRPSGERCNFKYLSWQPPPAA